MNFTAVHHFSAHNLTILIHILNSRHAVITKAASHVLGNLLVNITGGRKLEIRIACVIQIAYGKRSFIFRILCEGIVLT